MDEFLFLLALTWLVIASYTDLKKREVPNWLNFSLIIFALSYRAFFATVNSDAMFFVYGLIGLGIFVALGYGFYYARVFAGGDAKLLMALGAVLPVSSLIYSLKLIIIFIFMLLISGAIYGMFFSFGLAVKNKEKFKIEFRKQFQKYKSLFYIALVFSLCSFAFLIYFRDWNLIFFPAVFLAFPFLYVYAKSVENSCMIMYVASNKLAEGDWIVEKVRFKGKTILPYWEGLSSEQVKFLQYYRKKVKIKQGIPFVPAFLIAFILLLLWNSSWSFFKLHF